jgi:hypothetical protein
MTYFLNHKRIEIYNFRMYTRTVLVEGEFYCECPADNSDDEILAGLMGRGV